MATFSDLAAFLQSQPAEIKTLAFVAFYLIIADMLLGVTAALVCKEFRSNKMRNKWVIKILIYYAMISLGYVATILSGYWEAASLAYSTVLAIEVMSVLEKLVKMHICGNVSMGPLNKFVSIISPYFDIASGDNKTKGQTVITHTAVMSNDPQEPEIHVTQVDTTRLKSEPVNIEDQYTQDKARLAKKK